MPNISQTEILRPKSWDEFEDLVADLYAGIWGVPVERYGRTGQAQQGVDIYGQPAYLQGGYAGIQCKRYEDDKLKLGQIKQEIAKAETFDPPLAEYIIVTTDHCSAPLQRDIRRLNVEREAASAFPIRVVFWEDISNRLADPANRDLLIKYYGDWLRLLDVSGPHLSPFTLPPDLPTFTGRVALLDELDQLLQPDQETAGSVVGLVGMAGVGKSVLAVHVGHRWRNRFPDGVAWIDLREGEVSDGLRHVASLYGYLEEAARMGDDRKELSALIRTILRDKRTLLILDNCEGLSESDLACLLPSVPGSVTLVTSRRTFSTLERSGRVLRVDEMGEKEMLELFSTLQGPEKVQAERDTYRELAERLGFLPLALDIVGRRMRDLGWGPAKMIGQLEHATDLSTLRILPTTEQPEDSVACAFALSYAALAEEEQALFRALGPFAPAGFTAQAVGAMVEQSKVQVLAQRVLGAILKHKKTKQPTRGDVEPTLEKLETLSLLRRIETKGYYGLHPLLRDYARALAEQAGEKDLWTGRYARYFFALAEKGSNQLNDPKTAAEALAMATMERTNLLAAQRALLEKDKWKQVVKMAFNLNILFHRSGHFAAQRRALEVGLEAAQDTQARRTQVKLSQPLDPTMQRRAMQEYERTILQYQVELKLQMVLLAEMESDYPQAQSLGQEALDTARQLKEPARIAAALAELGNLAFYQADYAKARQLYQESLDIRKEISDKAHVASTLSNLGAVAAAQGDDAEAHRLYQECLRISREINDASGISKALHQLGVLAHYQQDYAEARKLTD
jgi:tetratricopeptide (TPR) repeat protein